MVSFRYHVVTIVAVFLALGLGVVAGTTVLDQGLVTRLENRTRQAEADARRAQEQVDEVREDFLALGAFLEEIRPHMIADRLAARRFVLVTYVGVDDATRDEAQTYVQDAGGEVVAAVAVADDADEEAIRAALADAIGLDATASFEVVLQLAAEELANRLSDGLLPDPGTDQPPRVDVLVELLEAGFLEPCCGWSPTEADVREIGGDGGAVVVVGGTTTEPRVPVDGFVMPLIEALAERQDVPLAAVEAREIEEWSLVADVRALEGPSADTLVTVDDLRFHTFGGTALVLGLEQRFETGIGGDYGMEDGAEALLPEPAATSE